jgi:hypothetical protein
VENLPLRKATEPLRHKSLVQKGKLMNRGTGVKRSERDPVLDKMEKHPREVSRGPARARAQALTQASAKAKVQVQVRAAVSLVGSLAVKKEEV